MGRQENQSLNFYQTWYEKHIFTCCEHYVRSALKTFHWCSWTEFFPVRQCTSSIHEYCAWLLTWYIFKPKDQVAWSGGIPMQSLDIYVSRLFFWTHLMVCCLHHLTKEWGNCTTKIQPECDKITEHILWYVQAAVAGHVIKCYNLSGSTVLKLLQ